MTAVQILAMAAARGLLPLSLSSREITENLAAEIRERSLFIARGTNLQFLARLAKVLDALLSGKINQATARLELMEELSALGYSPEEGFPENAAATDAKQRPGFQKLKSGKAEIKVPPAEPDSIRDISSRIRLDFILDTQAKLLFGAGQKAAGQDPARAYDYPAWELIRVAERAVPRGFVQRGGALVSRPEDAWEARFERAGGTLARGRIIALKGDPVWAALGSSELFDDAMDVDYPPFAFNSGMGWREVPRAECMELGVIAADYQPEGFAAWRLNEKVKLGAAGISEDLARAAVRELRAKREERGKVLSMEELIARANKNYLSRQ